MWTTSCLPDPTTVTTNSHQQHHHQSSFLVHSKASFESILSNDDKAITAFREGGRPARVALADYCSRQIYDRFRTNSLTTTTKTATQSDQTNASSSSSSLLSYRLNWEPLDYVSASGGGGAHHHQRIHANTGGGGSSSGVSNKYFKKASSNQTPYVLERTDIWCSEKELNVILRVRITPCDPNNNNKNHRQQQHDEKKMEDSNNNNNTSTVTTTCCTATSEILSSILGGKNHSSSSSNENDNKVATTMLMMRHVACVVAQNRLREHLVKSNNENNNNNSNNTDTTDAGGEESATSAGIVAFIADGSILPRKSGANNSPMASPPAVPSKAPSDGSKFEKTIEIEMGTMRQYLDVKKYDNTTSSTTFSITGMAIPKGITLVAGGGYHGKSTLLRALAAGVYDKIPGDGREFCVTVPDTISIRAEDGRYVNNCNVSAFISNLPTPPGVTHGTIDTTHFSSGEASGSTSQAANVAEAIEMGAKVFLVDEDVSAANFMARDGRMRALVMDESITPLLYRVNGMYNHLGVSCIVVVGGVGDWLDVPDQVILMNKYIASDATKKARSISYQFSYGHVQYAGKGVVHQLPWDKKGTPLQRRPTNDFLNNFQPDISTISLLDGGHAISIHPTHDDSTGDDDFATTTSIYDDDDDGYIDLSRCEQLVGKKPQLYGCGQCVIWLLREAKQQHGVGMAQLLSNLEQTIDAHGMVKIFEDNASGGGGTGSSVHHSLAWRQLLHGSGFAYRPRKYEIGQAFNRMRGIQLEHIPVEDDGEEARIAREAERRKQELAKMWAARRPKNVAAGQ